MRQKLVFLAGVILPSAQSDAFDGRRGGESPFGGRGLVLDFASKSKLFHVIVLKQDL